MPGKECVHIGFAKGIPVDYQYGFRVAQVKCSANRPRGVEGLFLTVVAEIHIYVCFA